jgi:uncharacterized protein (DUF486 family)
MPDIQINIIAIVIAVVANFFLGFAWYSVLFGRMWATEMGYNFDENQKSQRCSKL